MPDAKCAIFPLDSSQSCLNVVAKRGLSMIRMCCLVIVILCVNESIAQSFHVGSANSPKAGTLFVYPERVALLAGRSNSDVEWQLCQRGCRYFAPRSLRPSHLLRASVVLCCNSSERVTRPIFRTKSRCRSLAGPCRSDGLVSRGRILEGGRRTAGRNERSRTVEISVS